MPAPPLHSQLGDGPPRLVEQTQLAHLLATLDLTAFEEASVCAAADLVVDPPGAVNAVAVTFRADLHGAIAHTLDPWTSPESSWATSVWVLPDPLHVGPGAALRVHYSRRVDGTRDGLTCELVDRCKR